MAAIITDDFRRNAAQLLVSDVTTGGSNYYVGIGKSDAYDPDSAGLAETDGSFSLPVPAANRAEELEVLNNLATLSKVGTNSAFRVMPRVYYQASKRYKVYDPNDANCFFAETVDGVEFEPCYVINSDLEVFICLKNDGTTVTHADDDEPTMTATLNDIFGADETGKDNGLITTTDDDYRWAYVCTLNRDSGFFTTQFAAIGNAGSSAVDNPALPIYDGNNHPSETSGGLIYGFKVIDGGSGYTAGDLTVNCTGLRTDGTAGDNTDLVQFNQSITCTITTSGGAITQCVTKLDGGEINTSNILGVVNANAVVDGVNKTAILEPMILPLEGVGTDNLKLLPSYYCGIRANFEDDLGGDGLIIPFRQVSLLKDPALVGGDTPSLTSSYATGDAAKALRYVACSASLPAGITTGTVLFDNASGDTTIQEAIEGEVPIIIFDHLDTTLDRLYYHQNFDDDDSQNLLELVNDKTLRNEAGDTIAYTGGPQYPEFTIVDYTNANTSSGTEKFGQLNGEVLFIENRSSVTRAADQIEEVRMIIQF
jgi:hypothetical protein